MDIIDLLAQDNYILANKTIARLFGLDEAILLGELASEYRYWVKEGKLTDGYFFSTVENVKENTTLSDKRQRAAIATLKAAGIVEVKLMGLPAKRYIKLNAEQLLSITTDNILQNGRTSSAEMEELEQPKWKSNNNKSKSNKKNNKEDRESKRFIPPTLEEVKAYCLERKNNVDPQKFYDYFTASNWIDSKGNKVRSWKQKIITWESYSKKDEGKTYGANGIAVDKTAPDDLADIF